jgi:quinol-cytochrome oxidoreductase complex cytochrome b subunit
MGHVLSWGQISFLGATVITSFVTAIPVIGQSIVDWLWVGFIINNATLNRFFSLHFFLSFLIAEITLIHSALLHKNGSNNPLGVDRISFYLYFFVFYLSNFLRIIGKFGGVIAVGEFLIILIVSFIKIFVSTLCSVILITLYSRNFYYIKPFYRSNNFRFESVVFIFF